MPKPLGVRRIIVLNLGGIGDVLLSLPAMRLLFKSYPQSTITLLTIPRSADVFKGLGYIDDIMLFKPGLKEKVKLFLELSQGRFDLAINMRPLTSWVSSLKMAFIFFFIGARYRVGRNTQNRGFFLNIRIPEDIFAQVHDLDFYFIILEALGLESNERHILLRVDDEDSLYIRKFLAQEGVSDNDLLIGIGPGATWLTRHWPIENFARLIDLLNQERKCRVIIVASEDEGDLVGRLQSLCKTQLINASGKTNIGQLAALIKRCNLFIANDSGPMHLAAVLQTPLIALFGPGDLIRYDPRRISGKATKVVHHKADCAPCIKSKCENMQCFKNISPQEVKELALKFL